MGVRLPSEYQEVEYIQSQNGTSSIDTGFIPNSNKYIKIDMRFTKPNTNPGYFYGTSVTWFSFEQFQTNFYWNVGTSTTVMSHERSSAFDICDYSMIYNDNEKTLSVNGNRFTGEYVYKGNLPISPVELFSDGRKTHGAIIRLYYFKIYDGVDLDLARDFVPCYRKSDNKPGMYDLVTKQFFVNQGTGDDFLVGPDVIDSISPLMVAWRRMLMQKQKYGPNLLALSDFTRASEGATWVVDDQTGIITVSGNGVYSGASTQSTFVQDHLIAGHTYEMHCKLVSATNLNGARFAIRGVRGNEHQTAYTVRLTAVGEESSVVFTVDAYMKYFTLFGKWNDSDSQMVAYSDVWVKEILS